MTNGSLNSILQKVTPGAMLMKQWPLKGGIAATMTALEVQLPSGEIKKMIVRQPKPHAVEQNPNTAMDLFKILEILKKIGIPAQTPYLLDTSGEIFDESYLVIEYIEGATNFSPKNVSNCIEQMAKQLAAIHGVTTANADISFLQEKGVAARYDFQEFPEKLDDTLDETRIRTTLKALHPTIPPAEEVLVHGDYWPGNILWRDEKLVAVIDWDTARVGSPLRDLAIARLDVLWLYGIDAMHALTKQYASVSKRDLSTMPYWDLRAALRPRGQIDEWAAAYPDLGRSDVTAETMRAGHRLFIDMAFDKLSVSGV